MAETIKTDSGSELELIDINTKDVDSDAFDIGSDQIFVSSGGNRLRKAEPSRVAKAFLENYNGTELGGETQSVQKAFETLASDVTNGVAAAKASAEAAAKSASAASTSETNAMSATPDGYDTLAATFNALGLYVDDDGDVCQND